MDKHHVSMQISVCQSARAVSTAVLAIAAVPTLLVGQANIEGMVSDSVSGRPVIGAKVYAAFGRYGREETDSAGRYNLAGVRAGEIDFVLHCPSRTMLGKRLLARRMRVPRGTTRLNIQVDAALCDEPPYSERRGEFRGLYWGGFEESSFLLCADSLRGIVASDHNAGKSDIRAWVTLTPAARASWDRAATRDTVTGTGFSYVRWRGRLRGPGQYGHLGVSPYEMIVDSVAFVGPGDGASCLSPGDPRLLSRPAPR